MCVPFLYEWFLLLMDMINQIRLYVSVTCSIADKALVENPCQRNLCQGKGTYSKSGVISSSNESETEGLRCYRSYGSDIVEVICSIACGKCILCTFGSTNLGWERHKGDDTVMMSVSKSI